MYTVYVQCLEKLDFLFKIFSSIHSICAKLFTIAIKTLRLLQTCKTLLIKYWFIKFKKYKSQECTRYMCKVKNVHGICAKLGIFSYQSSNLVKNVHDICAKF